MHANSAEIHECILKQVFVQKITNTYVCEMNFIFHVSTNFVDRVDFISFNNIAIK